MQQSDIEIYEAFMRGESAGAIAKKYKIDKSTVKRIVNRVVEKRVMGIENVLKLQNEKA